MISSRLERWHVYTFARWNVGTLHERERTCVLMSIKHYEDFGRESQDMTCGFLEQKGSCKVGERWRDGGWRMENGRMESG